MLTVIGSLDLLAHPHPQARGDLRRFLDPPHPAHVDERLVDREPLDLRRRVVEDREDVLARVRIRREAR